LIRLVEANLHTARVHLPERGRAAARPTESMVAESTYQNAVEQQRGLLNLWLPGRDPDITHQTPASARQAVSIKHVAGMSDECAPMLAYIIFNLGNAM
jgi:hypothetical protein